MEVGLGRREWVVVRDFGRIFNFLGTQAYGKAFLNGKYAEIGKIVLLNIFEGKAAKTGEHRPAQGDHRL